MTDNPRQGTDGPESVPPALRLVRGDASPEELAALVAVLAAIPSAHAPAPGEGHTDPTGRPSPESGSHANSQWTTRRRVFHTTYAHGPGGWRASAFPR